jgi:Holliday junction resolvase
VTLKGGEAFEIETASRLTQLGWTTTSTPATGDWGADILARVGGEHLVVQCKDWGGPVGVGAVQEIAYARTHYKAQLAVVVARNGYTRAAKAAGDTAGVHLLGLEDLRVGTSIIDRSKEGARLRDEQRRRLARQEELYSERLAAAAWHEFDLATARRRLRLLWGKVIGITMIAIGAIAFIGAMIGKSLAPLVHRDIGLINVPAAITIVMLGGLLLCDRIFSLPPELPLGSRRSAVRSCPACDQRIRLEVGRSGWLTCPRCKRRFQADTSANNIHYRSPGNVDYGSPD